MLKTVTTDRLAVPFTWWRGGVEMRWIDELAWMREEGADSRRMHKAAWVWKLQQTGGKTRRYAPLEDEPGLFREFASLGGSDGEYLRFAERYGLLGLEDSAVEFSFARLGDDLLSGGRATEVGAPRPWSEDLWRWDEEHRNLAWAAELWDLLRSSKEDAAQTLAGSPPRGAFSGGLAAPEDSPPQAPPVNVLRMMINRQLARYRVEPFLASGKHRERQGSDPVMALHFRPHSLLGAMWLQLAFAITANQKHRRCEKCSRWFRVSPEDARTNRRYCSSACRQRGYRNRVLERQSKAGSGGGR